MASLSQEKSSRRFHLRFRFSGREFRRSLETTDHKLARAIAGRVEETLRLVHSGRLVIPPGADPIAFILSDGRHTGTQPARLMTLDELVTAFKGGRLAGVKERSTIKTEDIHLRHLLRLLKKRTFIIAITTIQLQQYVATRLSEVTARARPITTETVRKEVATFRVLWNWGVRQGLLQGAAPVAGLAYPLRDEKPPFMTREAIEQICRRDELNEAETRKFWECLYLRRNEVHEVLAWIRDHSKHDYLYPLTLLIAHTGLRLSEATRSRREDVDADNRTILVREKKRSRVRAITFRRVDLTPMICDALRPWMSRKHCGPHLFCRHIEAPTATSSAVFKPIDADMAREHLHSVLRKSEWSRLRGFHVFRHSFASNLAAAGVDQRIIDEWMGHQTDEMRRRYRHLYPESKKSAILKLMPEG